MPLGLWRGLTPCSLSLFSSFFAAGHTFTWFKIKMIFNKTIKMFTSKTSLSLPVYLLFCAPCWHIYQLCTHVTGSPQGEIHVPRRAVLHVLCLARFRSLSPHMQGLPALSGGAQSCGVCLARPGVRVPFCTPADASVGAPLFVPLTDLEALGGQGCTSRGPDLSAPHPVSLPCRRPGSEKSRRGLTHIPGSPLEGLWVSWTKHRRLSDPSSPGDPLGCERSGTLGQ